MKPQTLSGIRRGFLLFILLLFGVAANAARLETDRDSIVVGDVTTVHLLGLPFIAMVDWKVGPELEIVDSDKNHARVRGIKAGVGVVSCNMNLSTHTLEITVRDPPPAARPAQAPPVTHPASVTPPAYTTPPTATADPAGIWRLDAAGHTGELEISRAQGMLSGRVRFDAQGAWEPLAEMYFDEAIGELSFSRPGAKQGYRGQLRDGRLEGRFIQGDELGYSAASSIRAWSAVRAGSVASSEIRPVIARIVAFSWQGMAGDRVGEWGNGRPNGVPDGHFRLALELPDRQPVTSVSVWSARENGEKAGGQVWHSRIGSYWMLGVFRDERQLNASHIGSLGEMSGKVTLDLHANSSGWFNPGQTFLVEVETDAGKVLSSQVKIGAASVDPASLRLERDRYAPGEAIVVRFTAPEGYASNAWIGIIPSRVPHGSEAENDRHDLSYQYLNKRVAGSMTFIAPKDAGDYDLRLHDQDSNGREVASVSFRVE